jgi:hypothetical protein
MISIDQMENRRRVHRAYAQGMDLFRLTEEQFQALEEKTGKLEKYLIDRIARIRSIINDLLEEIESQINTSVPDEELFELEARITFLERTDSEGTALLEKAHGTFEALSNQNRSLAQNIRKMREVLGQSYQDDPVLSLIREGSHRINRSAAGLPPGGPSGGL